MLVFLAATWQRFAGYVVLVGGALLGAFLLYRKGNEDAKRDLELAQRRQDAASEEAAGEVRRGVGADSGSDVAERLRGWQRPGP